MKRAVVAKVFMSGNSQAIRLPKEFRLDTDEVFIQSDGDKLVLTPRMHSWDGFVEGLEALSDDFSVSGGLAEDIPRRPLT